MEKSAPPRRSTGSVPNSSTSSGNSRRRHRDRGRSRQSQDNHITLQPSTSSSSSSSSSPSLSGGGGGGGAPSSASSAPPLPFDVSTLSDGGGNLTTAMCFCCCCCYCSRNCLDCCNAEPSVGADGGGTGGMRLNECVGLLKETRKRKPPPIMSKAWHWVMLLMILFLFGVTMSLLSSTCSNSRGGGGSSSSVAAARRAQADKERTLQELLLGHDGGRGNEYYSNNSSDSYHHHYYGQLRVERPGEEEEEEKKGGTSSSSSGRGSGITDKNDSLGDRGPLTQQQCNLLQRILDSGIKSIQFLRSQYTRHSCTRIKGGGVAAEEPDLESKEPSTRRGNNYDNSIVLIVLSTTTTERTADDPDPGQSAWTLTNGNRNYHVRILMSFSGSSSSNQRPEEQSTSGKATTLNKKKHQTEEMWNQSFVVKNQFPIGFNRLTRANELGDNSDYLGATTSDNPREGGAVVLAEDDGDAEDLELETDEQSSSHSMGQPRKFHFLRKLQYIEEEEEDTPPEEEDEPAAAAEEEEEEEQEASSSPDPSQRSLEISKRDLRSPVNNPTSNASITLRGLERFLELVRPPPPHPPSPSSKQSETISPTTRNRQEGRSQLFRLEQRLSQRTNNGDGRRSSGSSASRPGGGGGKGLASAKKCKLNGKSTSCRRRKGMRRKAPSSSGSHIDNVQFTSIENNGKSFSSGSSRSPPLAPSTSSSKANTRKSSGDKWKFILENFCAKSHLHGQLPKLIAKLEQQEAAKKLQQQNKQDHGQIATATSNNQEISRDDAGKVQQSSSGSNKNNNNNNFKIHEVDPEEAEEELDEDEDELSMAAKTTDSLRLEVIKEQILKKLGLKRAPNITNVWTAAETSSASPPPSSVDGFHNDTRRSGAGGGGDDDSSSSSNRNRDGRRMVEKKTANFMFGNVPTGIQLPNNNSQFFIHDGHTRPMDQELFLSKELILATLYRAQLDNSVGGGGSGGGYQQSHEGDDGGYANPSYGQATNRLFDDLHAEDGRGRKKRRKGRKRKRKSQHHPSDAGWAAAAEHYEEEDDATQNDDEEAYLDSEALKSHTRRYLEAEDGYLEDEEDEYEERSHRYQWENNQQDDGQSGDEENYGQSREIITFAERGKLLNGRQHLLEFKPVGDHQTPGGGDFRIRSAVLWLKVEHLNNKQQQQQQDNVARNVTIWIFNMKTSGWDSAAVNDCPVSNGDSTATPTGTMPRRAATTREETVADQESVARNCPSSEFTNYEAADREQEERRRRQQQSLDADELDLDEKDFNRVSELALTHTIHLPSSAKYDYHAAEAAADPRGRGKFNNKNINREDVNFEPSGGDQHSSPLSSNGWHKFDITSVVRRWNTVNRSTGDGQRPAKLQLLIDCSGCRRTGVHVHLFHSNKLWNADQPPLVNENRPFLVAHTEPNAMKRVRRRAVDCSGARNGRCCKQRFYVSFKAIGWDDWIIFPHGYFANYCRGSCAYRTPDMLPTKYSQFMSEFRRLGKMAEMQPCCAPLKFSSMDLIYYDHDRKIIKSHLPQMIVDECGCP